MYRLVKMSAKWYALEINLETDLENIEEFIASGNIVVLVEELEIFTDKFEIGEDEIEIIEID